MDITFAMAVFLTNFMSMIMITPDSKENIAHHLG